MPTTAAAAVCVAVDDSTLRFLASPTDLSVSKVAALLSATRLLQARVAMLARRDSRCLSRKAGHWSSCCGSRFVVGWTVCSGNRAGLPLDLQSSTKVCLGVLP